MAQYRTDYKKLDGSNLVTRYEVNMLADQLTTSGTLTDSFGRLRTSTPFTLFDSSHRYADNGLWSTSNTAGGTYGFVTNQSLIEMTVSNASGAEVIRETDAVFSYQPGKSLMVMNTFVFNEGKTNLRQRVGYFGADNGIFLEQDGTDGNSLYLVRRSKTSGTVVDTRIPQSDWNVDKFDGTGASAQAAATVTSNFANGIDLTKTNILWIDFEWLGVGCVRCGFVVDGKFMPAHIFYHSNVLTLPYMSTASLPLRLEITNTGATSGSSTLKQICSTVLSEGGYELRGSQQSIGTPVASPKDMPTAGTFVPITSIRLKSTRLDAIVVPSSIDVLGSGNNTRIKYKVVIGGTLTGASWVSGGTNSSVEYDLSATAITGGTDVLSGYIAVTNQATQPIIINRDQLFKYQLKRNSFTSEATIFSVCCTGAANGDDALATVDWEEISR